MSVILNATTSTGLTMTPDNSGTVQFQTAGTNTMYIDGSGNVGIGTSSPSARLQITDGNFAQLYLLSSTTVSGVRFGNTAYTNGYIYYDNGANMPFQTNGAERMRIDSSGNLLVGTMSQQSTAILSVVGGASKNGIAIPVANGQTGIIVTNTGAYNYSAQTFFYNSSQVGTISISSTSTAYNTSSDYRLKTNVTPLTTAQSGPIIDALKPSQFTWTTDNTPDVGFIAHEMQAVIPKAVTGEKDAVDAEGKPVYQQVVVSSPEIIAYLVAELQSVRSRLAGLESTVATQATEIATLKAKVGA